MAAAPRGVGGAGHEHSLLESLTKRVASSSTLYLSQLSTVSNNGPLLKFLVLEKIRKTLLCAL